jgi:hypothetical protein
MSWDGRRRLQIGEEATSSRPAATAQGGTKPADPSVLHGGTAKFPAYQQIREDGSQRGGGDARKKGNRETAINDARVANASNSLTENASQDNYRESNNKQARNNPPNRTSTKTKTNLSREQAEEDGDAGRRPHHQGRPQRAGTLERPICGAPPARAPSPASITARNSHHHGPVGASTTALPPPPPETAVPPPPTRAEEEEKERKRTEVRQAKTRVNIPVASPVRLVSKPTYRMQSESSTRVSNTRPKRQLHIKLVTATRSHSRDARERSICFVATDWNRCRRFHVLVLQHASVSLYVHD